jgi:NitT/TauT family transport system ATP-binding protein
MQGPVTPSQSGARGTAQSSSDIIVDVSGVTHWFRELAAPKVVIDDFSLSVRHNEFVALVGPSGCGKTTILNMVAGLIAPERGRCEVFLGGRQVERPSRQVGYMFARDALLPWRSLRRNVELGLAIRGVPRAERRRMAEGAIERVGLAGYEKFIPGKLSQGMRQRGNLARLLVTSPELLLLDEPFSALDAQTRLVLQDQFIRIWETERQTVVLVTHDLGEAAALADRVVVMRKGRLQADVEVPFKRPRDIGTLRFSADFHTFLEGLHDQLTGGDALAEGADAVDVIAPAAAATESLQ